MSAPTLADSPPGTHRPPLDADGVRLKFEQLAARGLAPAQARTLWAALQA
jgi:hypothetical protein